MNFKKVLITGACGDIGRSLAQEFASRGAHLALCDLKTESEAGDFLSTLRSQTAKVVYRQTDVTDAAAVSEFVRTASSQLGRLDICIANAGIVERGPVIELSPESWRRTLEVNLTGCFLTAQAAAREMLRCNHGHIIFMSSWVQDVPRANIGAYCASKGGLKMLAKTMALELGPQRIRVNLVAPGFVDAGLTGNNLKAHPELLPAVHSEIPLGRLITSNEVAKAVAMLCSDDASAVTGATLLLDGGCSLGYRKK